MIRDEDGASFTLTHIKISQHLERQLYTLLYMCVCVYVCVLAYEKETLSTAPLASSSTLLK